MAENPREMSGAEGSHVVDADDDQPMTLAEACKVIFKDAIGPSTLMAEARRGKLVMERIGRRWFVTRAAIREMRQKCEVGHSERAPGFGSSLDENATAGNGPLSGPYETARLSAARDAVLRKLQKPSSI